MEFRKKFRSSPVVRYSLGVAAKGLSILMVLLAAVILLGVLVGGTSEKDGAQPLFGIWILLGFAVGTWDLGRRLSKTHTPSIGVSGSFVLYLRSFKHDRGLFNKVTSWLATGEAKTVEERVTLALSSMGLKTVAIGDPKRVIEFGSEKIYADDDWHKTVEELASGAALVIIRIGFTEGILWECTRLIQMIDPRRLILLNPVREHAWDDTKRKAYYTQFREMTAHVFSLRLPQKMDDNEIVYFDAAWSPRMLGIRQGTSRRKRPWWSAGDLARTLQPILEEARRLD